MVLISGLICFLLERDWYRRAVSINKKFITRNKYLNAYEKVPFYSILGVSLSFTLIFSLLDLINFSIGYF
jgi:hypothetical protein